MAKKKKKFFLNYTIWYSFVVTEKQCIQEDIAFRTVSKFLTTSCFLPPVKHIAKILATSGKCLNASANDLFHVVTILISTSIINTKLKELLGRCKRILDTTTQRVRLFWISIQDIKLDETTFPTTFYLGLKRFFTLWWITICILAPTKRSRKTVGIPSLFCHLIALYNHFL